METLKEYAKDKKLRNKLMEHMVDAGVPETVARIKVEHMGNDDVRSHVKNLNL
jgi:uncharacterized FAD-dependent dehydrogenase